MNCASVVLLALVGLLSIRLPGNVSSVCLIFPDDSNFAVESAKIGATGQMRTTLALSGELSAVKAS